MHCALNAAGACLSCTHLAVPYAEQVAAKQRDLERRVAQARPDHAIAWGDPLTSAESGFRTKAKMVVAGTVDRPTLGILSPDGEGVDLATCPLYPEALRAAFAPLEAFITRARLEPYHVPTRRGELKHVMVTLTPAGELMVRLVARSTESLARIRKHLPWLEEQLPALKVVSLNVLPEHKAVLEGEREIVLTPAAAVDVPLGDVTLEVRPQSFLQTNTAIAQALYAQVRDWVNAANPATVWDLYCGVGGFALHCLAPGRVVTGVETSEQAVASAVSAAQRMAAQRMSAQRMSGQGVPGAGDVTFIAADAVAWALAQPTTADLVVVNPPRRGIGNRLATWLNDSTVATVVYSSCNAATLATDLAAMPSLRPVRGRLLDMFPHTSHYEAVVMLERVRD